MDRVNDEDFGEEVGNWLRKGRTKNTSSVPGSTSNTRSSDQQGLPAHQQPGHGAGIRSNQWWERQKYPWELYPGPSDPRITLIAGVEWRWWIEPCAELLAGHEDQCPGYILEHTGPGGSWVKEKECPLHGFRRQSNGLSAQERAKEKQARLAAASIPDLFRNWTFYTFPHKEHGAYQTVMEYAGEGKITQSLLLSGSFGTGKTSLAVSVLQKRIDEHGERGLYTNVSELFEEIKSLFGRENASSMLMNRVLNVPLLVLDDLGAERGTEWVQSNLYNILNYRLTHNKPTIVTTNLDMQELDMQLGARTVERLKKPYYRVVYVGGTNLRDRHVVG